jgi:glutaredoxin
MRKILLCLVSLAVLASGANAQTLYRWVDKDGKVHYSDQPPPKEIKKVDQPRLGKSSIETSDLPYQAKKAAQDYPVRLYTAAECVAECKAARDYLSKRGIPFSEQSLGTPEDGAAFKKLFKTDQIQLPAITVGNQQQIGFAEDGWAALLDTAGYPRTALPGRKPAAQ